MTNLMEYTDYVCYGPPYENIPYIQNDEYDIELEGTL